MEHSVCFIGHRTIADTPALRDVLIELIEGGTVNFIFGDHSAFNDLCYEAVTQLKEKHTAIRRIRFRKDYEDADDYTMSFLITGFEDCICPKGVGSAGRASYVERNQAMIRESDVCVFYYSQKKRPSPSGTAVAYAYALQKKKPIINLAVL